MSDVNHQRWGKQVEHFSPAAKDIGKVVNDLCEKAPNGLMVRVGSAGVDQSGRARVKSIHGHLVDACIVISRHKTVTKNSGNYIKNK